MNTIASTLVHRVLEPEGGGAGPFPVLLFLHGRGADEEDLLGLAPAIDPRFLILSVRAPIPFPSSTGFTWYHMNEIGSPDQESFRHACDTLARFFNDMCAGYPIDPAKVFLFGFSMGAVMAFSLSLTQPELVRGVVAHSGYIPEVSHLSFRWDGLQNTSFFVAHGTEDPIIPVRWARRAKELLDASPARSELREYPMAHTISDRSASDAAAWLRAALDAPAS